MMRATLNHRKMLELADLLAPHSGAPFEFRKAMARGLMATFWGWVGENAPTGSLVGFNNATIAEAAEWRRDPDVFVEALGQVGFLVPHTDKGTRGWALRNYRDNADRYTHNKLARRGRRFWCGAPPTMSDMRKDEQAKCQRRLAEEDRKRIAEAGPPTSGGEPTGGGTGQGALQGTVQGTLQVSGQGPDQDQGQGQETPKDLAEVLTCEARVWEGKGFPQWEADAEFREAIAIECRDLVEPHRIDWPATLRQVELKATDTYTSDWVKKARLWIGDFARIDKIQTGPTSSQLDARLDQAQEREAIERERADVEREAAERGIEPEEVRAERLAEVKSRLAPTFFEQQQNRRGAAVVPVREVLKRDRV